MKKGIIRTLLDQDKKVFGAPEVLKEDKLILETDLRLKGYSEKIIKETLHRENHSNNTQKKSQL